MKNGWTGGQYSLFRAALAIGLCVQFTWMLARQFNLLPALDIGLCVLFGIGLYHRIAALGLSCLGVGLLVHDPSLANLSSAAIGFLLLIHLCLPPRPYGSWAARGRVDLGGGWRMPAAIFAATWVALAVEYSYLGYTKLVNPSRIHVADWLFGFVMLHLLAFDPGWIRPLSAGTERLFYDGHCGLCQRSVRLILAEDATGSAFLFAPLQGETFAELVSPKEREALPLSLVVRTETGALLTRSAGVLHILRRLGGWWRILAGLLALLPRWVRDRLYDGVARIRHRIFARPAELCPLMPPHLRARFDP